MSFFSYLRNHHYYSIFIFLHCSKYFKNLKVESIRTEAVNKITAVGHNYSYIKDNINYYFCLNNNSCVADDFYLIDHFQISFYLDSLRIYHVTTFNLSQLLKMSACLCRSCDYEMSQAACLCSAGRFTNLFFVFYCSFILINIIYSSPVYNIFLF